MGEPQTSHFYDFGIVGRVPGSQSQLFFIFGDTQTPKFKQEKPWNVFKTYAFRSLQSLGIHNFVDFGKEGHRTIPKIRLINSWKAWIWDQYPSKTWNKKPRNQESEKPRNQETNTNKPRNKTNKKPRNQGTKEPRNQENKKPRTLYPSTYRLQPLHPTSLGYLIAFVGQLMASIGSWIACSG